MQALNQTSDLATDSAFDFDSNEHRSYQKTPAAKSINTPAGLWIADENRQLAGWYEDRPTDGIPHEVTTNKFDEETGEQIKIPGLLFKKPRILVIGRSPLLRAVKGKAKPKIEGIYNKQKHGRLGYAVARRYFIMFLDSENKPLHVAPIQLTAFGSFQVNFDQQLSKFREALQTAYAQSKKKPLESKTELWHAMGIFCPQMKTEIRGLDLQSPACITIGFTAPTPDNWLTLCVGRDPIAQEIAILHDSIKDWWKRGLIEEQENSEPEQEPEQEQAQPEFDNGWMPKAQKLRCDRNSLMIESEKILTQLEWSPKAVKEYLLRAYQKQTRTSLSDEEIIDFVGKLQAIFANSSIQHSDFIDPEFSGADIPY